MDFNKATFGSNRIVHASIATVAKATQQSLLLLILQAIQEKGVELPYWQDPGLFLWNVHVGTNTNPKKGGKNQPTKKPHPLYIFFNTPQHSQFLFIAYLIAIFNLNIPALSPLMKHQCVASGQCGNNCKMRERDYMAFK